MVLAHVLQYDLAIEVSISTTMLVCPFDIQIGCTRILNIVRTTHQILLELEYVRDKNITLDYYLSLGFSGAKYSMYYAYSYYPARCLDYLSLQQLRYYFPIIIFILTHPVNFLCGGGGGGRSARRKPTTFGRTLTDSSHESVARIEPSVDPNVVSLIRLLVRMTNDSSV